MAKLKNWRAKRAGGRITVYGENPETNAQAKIVGVDVIYPPEIGSAEYVVALDKHGNVHHLLLG